MSETKRAVGLPDLITSFNDTAFLKPPHHHDLHDLLDYTCAPPSVIGTIDPDFRDAIQAVIMSTSILFASVKRLRLCQQDLTSIGESSESRGNACGGTRESSVTPRCTNSPDPVYFNSKNRLEAEWFYLQKEALPDWRHKARLVTLHLSYADQSSLESRIGWEAVIRTWWHALQDLVASWEIEACRLSLTPIISDETDCTFPRHKYDSLSSLRCDS